MLNLLKAIGTFFAILVVVVAIAIVIIIILYGGYVVLWLTFVVFIIYMIKLYYDVS